MRYFKYNEYNPTSSAADDAGGYEVLVSEEDIMIKFFPYWRKRMKMAGKENQISYDNCLEDWIIVNWAWEV